MTAADVGIRIVIAMHKAYSVPSDPVYLPMHVGAILGVPVQREIITDSHRVMSWIGDDTGDNISFLNPHFCELTGMYWAWRNLDSDYIGLVHYRRYFALPGKRGTREERIITGEELRPIIAAYPVIVPAKRRYYIETLYSHYEHTHGAVYLDRTREVIAARCPEYLGAFDRTMGQRWGYMFNMMIMEREWLDRYCSWLFPILFDLEAGSTREEKLSAYDTRFYGRVSEIIFNVWLSYQQETGALKPEEIKELPVVYMEHVNWLKKGSAFLKAKFFHVRYKSSF